MLPRNNKPVYDGSIENARCLQEHKAKHEEQKRLFELFRKTMSNEVEDIHKLQAEMARNHSTAFQKLSSDLLETASFLKNFTDAGLTDANGRVTSLSEKQVRPFPLLACAGNCV